MNKHLLNKVTSAILPLGIGLASVQPAGAYAGRSSYFAYGRNISSPISAQSPLNAPHFLTQTSLLSGSFLNQNQKKVYAEDLVISSLAAVETDSKLTTVNTSQGIEIKKLRPVKELVVIDATIDDKQTFYKKNKPGVEIVEIQFNQNSLAQLTELLTNYHNLDALHLVSHADNGVIYLGETQVTEQVLRQEINTLSALDGALKDGGDLLLYGCNLASEKEGEALLELIANQANIDVAASNNITGGDKFNADWDLEIIQGDINTEQPFSEVALRDFSSVLGIPGTITFTVGVDSGAYGGAAGTDATYTNGGFTVVADGQDVSTSIRAAYDVITAGAAGGIYESKLTVLFQSGATFDATSVTLQNYSGANRTFTVTSDVAGDSATSNSLADLGSQILPLSGFTGITKLYITPSASALWDTDDLIVANVTLPNTAPTITGTPASVLVTEDVATDVNLSTVTFADADGDSLTATLTASSGTLASSDGNGTFAGVTVAGSGSASMTLAGTAANINTYLDTTTKINYTSALNDTTARNIAVIVNDGTDDSATSNITVNITDIADIVSETVPANSTYGLSGNLDFTLTFDESVTVSGTPRIALNIGGVTKYATFSTGNATATTGTILTFRYVVEAGLSDADGIGVTNSIDLNGGTIVDTDADGSGADLSNISFASTAGVLVDSIVIDSDGSLTAAAGVTEPVGLPTTVDTALEAVNLFDFTLSDGGTADGLAMTVSQIVVNVSGTSTDLERGKVTWRLNGTGASNIIGVYNGGTNTITFSTPSISIADGFSEIYTINGYYNDNTGIVEDRTFILSVDGDTDLTVGAGGTQMSVTTPVNNGVGGTFDVTATALAFTTQPAGSVSGSALTTQPVITARDAFGNTDLDFTETVTLSEASAGSLVNNTVAATSGVATFSGLNYTATADQQSFTLTANDQDGVGSNLPTVNATAVTSDVVATKLIYSTQPAPTTVNSGEATAMTSVPVVSAVDANDIVDTGYSTGIALAENGAGTAIMSATSDTDVSAATVTIAPASGVSTFTGLNLTYTSSGATENFTLRATSGGLTAADSTTMTGLVSDSDGSLTAAAGVTEPVGLPTTVDTALEAVNLFDFNLSDGGTADGLAMTVSQIVVNVSGTSTDLERGKVTWRLNGNDASNVSGVYNAISNTITFSALSISIANATSETYTVNGYYNDNTGIVEDRTFILSVDGDTDLTVGAGGTQMSVTTAVNNGAGGTFDVTATALAFTTQPAGSVSGSALTTQPVITARDAFGNTDVDFTETVTLSEASAGSLVNNTVAATSGVATFSGLNYTATADQQSFTLTANDQDGVGSNLPTVNATAVTSDVVATRLIYSTQPAPTTVNSGEATVMTTVPVVSAVDANDIVDTGYSTGIALAENGAGTAIMSATGDTDVSAATVTILSTSGVSTFTGLNLTYTSSGATENFTLRATSGGLTAADSTTMTGLVDTTPPTISAVSIPNSAHKVGDIVTATITVASDTDDYTTGLGGISGSINGYTLGSFSKLNNTTYTATFTVTDGGTDVAAASNIAVNFTMADSAGNTSAAYTTAISQAGDAIYANLPTVNLTASSNTLAEDGGTSTLTATLSGSLNNQWPVDVTTNLAYTGTATITTDYTGAAAITIAAGSTTGTTIVTSVADALYDATTAETIIVDISTLSVGTEGLTNQQTLNITDAESAPTTTLLVGSASIAENGGTSTISASLSNPTYADVTVNLIYSGTATLGGTDANTPSALITIPAGATTANAATGITAVDDVLGEGDETIIVDIDTVSGGSASESGIQQQTITIIDDEDTTAPTISVVSIPNTAHKVGDIVTATITVASDTDDYTTGSGGISGSINGYTLGSFSKLNNTTYTATFTVTDGGTDVAAASNIAVNFTMTDSIGNTSAAYTTAISQAGDAIYANLPTVNLTASSNTLAEDGGTSTLTATLSGSLNSQWPVDVTTNLAYTGTATITTDYTGAAAITIAAGSTTGTTIVTSVADALYDATTAETIIVDISTLSVGTEGLTNQQTLNITDAESAPATTLLVGSTTIAENGGTSTIGASLSNPTFADVTVNLSYSGSATLGVDTNTPGVSITIPAGAATANTFTGIIAADDALIEGDENIIIDITTVSGGSATVNGAQQQTVTITDDESVNVTLSVNAASIAEVAGTSNVTATLSQATFADVTVSLGYTGTATNITDYTKADTITIPVGQTRASATIASVTDAIAETDETVIIDITGVTGGNAVESGIQQQTVTIVDNKSPVNTVLPVISGNAVVGGVLSASNGSWNDAENDTLSFAYQWKSGTVDIAGAVASSYTVTNAELGQVITVVVTASDGINPGVSVTSAGTSAIDSDFDGDGTGDATDLDDDNDGIPDAWETANGLDPLDATDAAGDLDGDGVSNLDEYLASSDPNVDDNPPVVTPPADITLDSVGLFTPVSVGVATATDVLDGALTASSDASGYFSPGVNIVTWSATDAAGNTGTATQNVNIIPLVSFASDQLTSEGSSGSVRVILNGDAVSYPVTVPYTLGGTAATDGSDHNLVNGIAMINSGTEALVSFSIVDDGAGEGVENIVLTMGVPTNAVAGQNTLHTIDIIEGNIAPVIGLTAIQLLTATHIAVQADGPVSVTSTVTDPNPADTFSYDWSATDNALIDTDGVDSSFTFDPSLLSEGLYTLRVSVSDGSASSASEITLNVVSTTPALTTNDSDSDGIDDLTEGYGDSDSDGIPEYLDAIDSRNVLQGQAVQSERHLLETEAGLGLELGRVAFQSGNAQSEVSMTDISDAGLGTDDSRYEYLAGLFDITVTDLSAGGQTINVVIAQRTQIPADAVYRNLLAGGWQSFVEDTANLLASAPGVDGYCPPPGDSAYQSGLNEGDWCVQLSIEDGGVNDADSTVNNRITVTGGITQRLPVRSGSDNGSDSVDNRKKAAIYFALGSMSPLWLAVFALVGLRRFLSSRKENI